MNQENSKGFTLLEIMIALAIFAIAILGVNASLYNSMKLDDNTREYNTAYNKMQEVIAKIKGEVKKNPANFAAIYTAYNDPNGANSSILKDGKVSVEFILNETITLPPLDINGDGDKLSTNVALANVKICYIKLKSQWNWNKNVVPGKFTKNAQMSAIIYLNPNAG